MHKLWGCRWRVWTRDVAVFFLLGVAEAGIGVAIPTPAAAYRQDLALTAFVGTELPGPSAPTVVPPTPPTLSIPTPSLPVPTLPAVSPPPVPVPTPTLPVQTPPLPGSSGPSPSPSPGLTPSPVGTPLPGGPGASSGQPGSGSGGSPSGGGWPAQGIQIPFLGLVLATPLDAALATALAALPLLCGIWILLFGRTWNEARRARQAQVRLAIAHELGIRPRELVSVGTAALFKLREHTAFDELTGTLRRAGGMAALDREISRARRLKSPLTVAFVDLDGLKQVNDRRGHKAGDELLRGLASVLRSGLRGQDLVIRYGGDEFVCVMPDTPADGARAKLSSMQSEADSIGLRFSAGAAQLERSDDVVSLLARADRDMYEAKARRGEVWQLRPDPAPRPDLRSQPDLGA